MNVDAITAAQRARRAIVYIRQSTERQVLQNKESQHADRRFKGVSGTTRNPRPPIPLPARPRQGAR